MNISDYYSEQDGRVVFSRQQSSDFAKRIADDFNPIHNPDSRRFVVPGDLLFAVTLARYGLFQKMQFDFKGMVTEVNRLAFPDTAAPEIHVLDEKDKLYLSVQRAGDVSRDAQRIAAFTLAYVEFSGHTFLDVLVPLMQQHAVMINPQRPLIIYERMAFDLQCLPDSPLTLELTDSILDIVGKRGNVQLHFAIRSSGELVGSGEKRMVLSGLRELDPALMQTVVDDDTRLKRAGPVPG